MNIYDKLKEMQITLPAAPAKGGVYTPAKILDNGLVFVSGCGPSLGEPVAGKLGKEYGTEQGAAFARNCMLNVLVVLEAAIGDLNRVKNCVKLLVLVAGSDEFYEQPQVANGGSGLLVEIFGEEKGAPSRSAIGVNALPGNIPVEIEAIFEIE